MSKLKACRLRQQFRPSPPVAPMQPWNWPAQPRSRLHIEYAGPVEGKMFLIIIDASSKWLENLPGHSTTSFCTIQQLRPLFARFGNPDCIVSDDGTPFTSEEFESFCCKCNGIRHIRVDLTTRLQMGWPSEQSEFSRKDSKRQLSRDYSRLFVFAVISLPDDNKRVSRSEL